MIEILGEILVDIVKYADAHPDLVKSLAAEAEQIVAGHTVETMANPEAIRAMSSGLAAARANAVQEYIRRTRLPGMPLPPK